MRLESIEWDGADAATLARRLRRLTPSLTEVTSDVSEVIDDSVKSSANTLRYAVSSMWRTDLRPELQRLRVPALIVHGGRDDIVNPNQADLYGDVAMSDDDE